MSLLVMIVFRLKIWNLEEIIKFDSLWKIEMEFKPLLLNFILLQLKKDLKQPGSKLELIEKI